MASVNSSVLCNIGLRIRDERKKCEMSQSELAIAIGSNKSKISNIETARTIPTMDTIIRIGDVLGVPITDFMVVKTPEPGMDNFLQGLSGRLSGLSEEKQKWFKDMVNSALNFVGM